jgi:hypothetical protein
MKSEAEIRASWAKWNATCHPEDRISFMDYLGELGIELKEEDEDIYDEEDEEF